MFISSYNTYASSGTSDKGRRYDADKRLEDVSLYFKRTDSAERKSDNSFNLPVNYILKRNFDTKLEPEFQKQQLQNPKEQDSIHDTIKKFTNYQTLQNAKTAYEENSKLFSIFSKKPHLTQNQTPNTDKRLPKDIQEIKEKNMRNTMVNTYLANDKYYQITA
ncbi:hypothetical protein KKG72_10655 [bacterium]|nr:hypothetical protein [bacterium]MBU1993145.1 hypothetical protein [bacterium]